MTDRDRPGPASVGTTPPSQGSDTPAEMVLMTVIGRDGTPSVAEASEELGVALADIDAAFGVIAVDLEEGLYAVRVRGDRVSDRPFDPDRGPFSDPQVSTFGPSFDRSGHGGDSSE